MKTRTALIVTLLLGWAPLASAQAVKLEFRDGLVNLSTQNAPLRAILAEWTRLGGTKIVNGDRIPGAPLTIQLTGVSERQAIETLLRTAAGYIVGPREIESTGASSFGSILILPTSVTTGRQAPASAAQPFRPQPQARDRDPDPEPEDPDDDPVSDVAEVDDRPAAATVREAAEEARRRLAERRTQQLFVGDQVIEQQDPEIQPAAPPPAGNPFNVPPGAVRPGIITPVPAQPDDRRRQVDQEP